jgi:predicted aspartyl protease
VVARIVARIAVARIAVARITVARIVMARIAVARIVVARIVVAQIAVAAVANRSEWPLSQLAQMPISAKCAPHQNQIKSLRISGTTGHYSIRSRCEAINSTAWANSRYADRAFLAYAGAYSYAGHY